MQFYIYYIDLHTFTIHRERRILSEFEFTVVLLVLLQVTFVVGVGT